ncbi:hypothetical protein C0J52_20407 [Blattella germanica]|nr:hypothetical protein C0J52_20407 [Blattella germanica]
MRRKLLCVFICLDVVVFSCNGLQNDTLAERNVNKTENLFKGMTKFNNEETLKNSFTSFGIWIPGEKLVYFIKEIFLGGTNPLGRVFSATHGAIYRLLVNYLNGIVSVIQYAEGILWLMFNIVMFPLRLIATPIRRVLFPLRFAMLSLRFFPMLGINLWTFWTQGGRSFLFQLRRRLHRYLSARNGAFCKSTIIFHEPENRIK